MLLPKLPLLRLAIFAIRSPDAAAASSPYGSKNHSAALCCRQADSAAAAFCVLKILRRHARGEPSAELPAARARLQWFMTEEEGVRLKSSLFLENGPAGICKAVFAEPIAPKSTKLHGRVGAASL